MRIRIIIGIIIALIILVGGFLLYPRSSEPENGDGAL